MSPAVILLHRNRQACRRGHAYERDRALCATQFAQSRPVGRRWRTVGILPGKFIFGIHVFGTKGNKIGLYDQWFNARQARDTLTIEAAVEIAKWILRETSNSEYTRHVSSWPQELGIVQLSDERSIDAFEIVPSDSI
jgi:hypothetical protein